MIKMFSAFTEEIDDVNAAIDEIMSQLDIENSLMKNSIGILHCYYEFIDSGVVKALSEKLPFEVVGITVPYVCLSGRISSLGLMLNIFTGDDVNFTTGLSEKIDIGGGNIAEITQKLCDGILEKTATGEMPPMLMTYAPFLHVLQVNADEFVGKISDCFPSVPVFGALSFSERIDFSECYTLYNGESYENSAILVAVTGNVNPQFLTMAVPRKNIIGELATVTKSEGNIIHTINSMSVEDYVISTGLIEKRGELEKLYTTPMIAKLTDGSTIIRVCIGGDGQGGAVMGGHVPEGAEIGFVLLELSDIVSTSEEIVKSILEISNGRNIVIYSCMARIDFMGVTQRELEIKTICSLLGEESNFCLVYAGGEIFPQQLSGGEYASHLQNFSLTVCIL
ncbi:MAG: FIST C-terminal domain-containing protein [Oscillospiraceae bacterium]|nr:FIST C-terminal domain-containing protein [Oscillospiraceae bacterium]